MPQFQTISLSETMHENQLSRLVVDAAYHVHYGLGPGLFESVYQRILAHELTKRGLRVQSEAPIPVVWDGADIEIGFRADLIVESKVIVEVKSLETLAPIHHKQLLTYLKLTGCRLGLLLNFGSPRIKEGIVRLVYGLTDEVV